MKILFLTTHREAPSAKWRVLQFIPYFEKAGVQCFVQEWPSGTFGRLSLVGKVSTYDIVFLQKRLLPKLLLNRLRKNARKLIYEFDDVVTLRKTDEGMVGGSTTKDRRFKRTIEAADAVLCTNSRLAELAEKETNREDLVHVFPTVIDLSRWIARTASRESAHEDREVHLLPRTDALLLIHVKEEKKTHHTAEYVGVFCGRQLGALLILIVKTHILEKKMKSSERFFASSVA